MKPRRLPILAVLLLAAGCATTAQQHPIERGIAIEKSFTQAVSWVNWGLRNGYISQAEGGRLAPHVNAGSALLDELQAEIVAGGDGSRTAARIMPHLEAVLRAQVMVERAKKTFERGTP